MSEKVPQWFENMFPIEKTELLAWFDVVDESLFCAAFMSSDDYHLRRKAVKKIEDQDRLWHYAVHDPDDLVRAAAAAKLTDNDRLLSIVQNDADRKVRMDAAGQLTDREMLYQLATEDPDRWNRKAAILAMQDESDLMMIVFSENEENTLRFLAAQKITDEECLKYIFNSRERLSQMDHHNAIRDSVDIRMNAILKIADHGMLRAAAADYGEITAVRIAAVTRLGDNDQDILEMIAAKPFDPDPRRDPDLYYNPELKAAAVARLTDESLLRRYMDDNEIETRVEARLALGDPGVLRETVEDPDWPIDVRMRAMDLITDQDFLYDYAMHHDCSESDDEEIAAAAAKKVQDPAKLADIVLGAEEDLASAAALEEISDDEQLLRVIREIDEHAEKRTSGPEDVWVQETKICAAAGLDDIGPLIQLALDDQGDHYEINNFKEYSIGLLSGRPELMLEYVSKETDEWALALAANCSTDERVLQAIADKGLRDTYAAHKLNNIRRIAEVGLGAKRQD